MSNESDYERYLRLAGSLVRDPQMGLNPEKSSFLIRRVAALLEEEVRRERIRSVESCRHRADLWRNTLAAREGTGPGRDEARARGNEALYLAHMIEQGIGVPQPV